MRLRARVGTIELRIAKDREGRFQVRYIRNALSRVTTDAYRTAVRSRVCSSSLSHPVPPNRL
jgi:transposase-like protein